MRVPDRGRAAAARQGRARWARCSAAAAARRLRRPRRGQLPHQAHHRRGDRVHGHEPLARLLRTHAASERLFEARSRPAAELRRSRSSRPRRAAPAPVESRPRRRPPRRPRRAPRRRTAPEPRGALIDSARPVGMFARFACGSGETGRRTSLRGWRGQPRGGSNPLCRTTRSDSRHWGVVGDSMAQLSSNRSPARWSLRARASSPPTRARARSRSASRIDLTPSTEENRRAYREMLFRTAGRRAVHQRRDPLRRDDPPEGRRRHAASPKCSTKQGHPARASRSTRARSRSPLSRRRRSPRGSTACASGSRSTAAWAPRFAKWRAVITIGDGIPSDYCIDTNAHALARYAALCVEGGLVPIVEPEVLMDGAAHDRALLRGDRAHAARGVRRAVRAARAARADPAQAEHGALGHRVPDSRRASREVAERRCAASGDTVPAAVPGIVFLSGGQSDELATAHLSR